MARRDYPSERCDRFLVRMPDGLKDRIFASAKANRRSVNNEVVVALIKVFGEAVEAVAENSLQAGSATVPNETALQGGPITHG